MIVRRHLIVYELDAGVALDVRLIDKIVSFLNFKIYNLKILTSPRFKLHDFNL